MINKNKIDTAPAYKMIITKVKNLIFNNKKINAAIRKSAINIKAEYTGFAVKIISKAIKRLRVVKNLIKKKFKIINVVLAAIDTRREGFVWFQ